MHTSAKKYFRFTINIICILLLTVIADQIIGKLLQHYYFRQESGLYYRTTYAMDSTKAEILVFGSSRANHHYVPYVFEDSLKLSFYNTGRDGNFLLYSYAVFKSVVSRYTPRIIIFDISPTELYNEENEYERLSSLLPYYKSHPEIRPIVKLRSQFEQIKHLSRIYPYNSSILTIAIGITNFNKTRKGDQKGYIPLNSVIIDTILHSTNLTERKMDSNKLNAITEIITYCISHKIDLIFVQSPMYEKINETQSTINLRKLASEKNVPFWNLINENIFLTNPSFFQDKDHLNNRGAEYFSRMLVSKIKN